MNTFEVLPLPPPDFYLTVLKKKLFILNMNTKLFPPKYIWSNFVQYLRIHLPWKTDINPNSIRGKSFSCSIDSQLCFTGVQKYIEKMAPRKSYVLRHQVSIFVNIWKKLKFVEWFSWCNKLCCLWEESKFFSFFKIGFSTLVNTLRCVLASFVACAGQQ